MEKMLSLSFAERDTLERSVLLSCSSLRAFRKSALHPYTAEEMYDVEEIEILMKFWSLIQASASVLCPERGNLLEECQEALDRLEVYMEESQEQNSHGCGECDSSGAGSEDES